jgi:hypothetical protein
MFAGGRVKRRSAAVMTTFFGSHRPEDRPTSGRFRAFMWWVVGDLAGRWGPPDKGVLCGFVFPCWCGAVEDDLFNQACCVPSPD